MILQNDLYLFIYSTMKHLLSYKIFEEASGGTVEWRQKPREEKIGALLHLYGSIPVSKEKAAIVINKIVMATKGDHFKLTDNYIIPGANKLHDQLRFADYFDSLLTSKDTRGHNFEGLIAGLFGGELTRRGTRSDVIINGEGWSVKFVNSKSESPVLGSIKSALDRQRRNAEKFNKGRRTGKRIILLDKIGDRTVVEIFKSDDDELKEAVFNVAFRGTTGFIIGYPDVDDNNEDVIRLHVLSFDEMRSVVCGGGVVNPKNSSDVWSLRVASSYRRAPNKIEISIPTITDEELNQLIGEDDNRWAKNVFGYTIARRMRPDVIQDIRKDKEKISQRLDSLK